MSPSGPQDTPDFKGVVGPVSKGITITTEQGPTGPSGAPHAPLAPLKPRAEARQELEVRHLDLKLLRIDLERVVVPPVWLQRAASVFGGISITSAFAAIAAFSTRSSHLSAGARWAGLPISYALVAVMAAAFAATFWRLDADNRNRYAGDLTHVVTRMKDIEAMYDLPVSA